MAIVKVNGVNLHVQRIGKGPTVVMLHGAFSTLTDWYFTVAPILASHHECIMYDLRGHGRSERVTSGFDLETLMNDLLDLLNELRLEKVPMLGHSFGALVTMRLALAHPERVPHLVVIEAPLPPTQAGWIGAFTSKTPSEMLEVLPTIAQQFIRKGGRKARELLKSIAFLARETSLISDIEAEADFTDEDLARIRCPTLCIYGADSSCLDAGQRLGSKIHGARLEIMPGGHYLHWEHAARLGARISRFLQSP